MNQKHTSQDKEVISVFLPKELKKDFRMALIAREEKLPEVLTRAVCQYVNEYKKRGPTT